MAIRPIALPNRIRTANTGGLGVSSLSPRNLVQANALNNQAIGIAGTEGNLLRGIGDIWGSIPYPKIVQVVCAHSRPQFAIAANTTFARYVDIPNLVATITPTSNTSRILILGTVSGGIANSVVNQDVFCEFSVTRNGVIVNYFGYGAGYLNIAGGNQYGMGWGTTDIVCLDAPATTSLVTYRIQVNKFQAGGTLYVNWANYGSSLALLEVAE